MSKRKLLLADDSITIQKVVNLTFADEGIEVVAVSDGDAAMIKFNESMPDLVLADVNMPGLDGYRICEMIKQDDETKHIPVILLVGSFEPFDEQEAFRVGADDFLTKPFQSIRQLVTKVSDLLNPPSATNNSAQAASVSEETEVNNDWQFADTKELPVEVLNVENFGDTGMDDEMIQTSQVNEPAAVDDVQQFISDSYSYKENESESVSAQETLTEDSFQDESAEDFAILEPTAETGQERFTDEDLKVNTENSDSKVYEFADYEIAEKEVAETVASTEPEYVYADKIPEKVSDWTVVTPELQEPTILDEVQIIETETDEVRVADETRFIEPQIQEETNSIRETFEVEDTPQKFSVKSASTVAFDEFDFLELPPLVEETGIRPQSEIKTFIEESEPEVEETNETEAPIETSETVEIFAESDTTSAQTFPPELIESVVQKVIERLSDKIIREIGWEVVPPMADLIVKKIVEEHFEKQAKEMSE